MLLNQDKFQSFLIFVITVNIATSQNPSYQSSNQYQSQYIIGSLKSNCNFNKTYIFPTNVTLNFQDGVLECGQANANVVFINDQCEYDEISNFTNFAFWLAIQDFNQSEIYLNYYNNKLLNFSKWDNGQPNNQNQSCAIQDTNDNWNEKECNFTAYNVVCEVINQTTIFTNLTTIINYSSSIDTSTKFLIPREDSSKDDITRALASNPVSFGEWGQWYTTSCVLTKVRFSFNLTRETFQESTKDLVLCDRLDSNYVESSINEIKNDTLKEIQNLKENVENRLKVIEKDREVVIQTATNFGWLAILMNVLILLITAVSDLHYFFLMFSRKKSSITKKAGDTFLVEKPKDVSTTKVIFVKEK